MSRQAQNNANVFPMNARPAARATIQGDMAHQNLHGTVDFFPYQQGTLVLVRMRGLPDDPDPCAPNIYAMHIHAGGDCGGDMQMPFSGAGGHYNPNDCPHPAHAGDMPPLFGNRGYAWQSYYTERFTPREVLGKTVIVHGQRDDFSTQPAGDAGSRIGCGLIQSYR